jgi:hypothetical protein
MSKRFSVPVLIAALLAVPLASCSSSNTSSSSAASDSKSGCAASLAGWVSNMADQALNNDPNTGMDVITTFGSSSPIDQWIMSEESNILPRLVQQGAKSAGNQLADDAMGQCAQWPLSLQNEAASNRP